uniref:Polymerase nucleotidyl transferase domain-containing protein n=1 Tax=Chromera velia CCMP2878 TaxID=1169474 RepID=A0A0G4HD31_9ALVE|eukprot:Cvel_26170.t1-p1 / transcript=Cvel_26170.t1 / gene=Cvel_26170 / organism=Chromera_velia_CCMP2878 / gene_product=hypothetical protein / transcript_product=hypothetical protein / location=Cvel_scaffold3074:14702-16157(+) / protein_length=456 / sequence_SO=supercontig / SO=protein_coding / is_pseudo=false
MLGKGWITFSRLLDLDSSEKRAELEQLRGIVDERKCVIDAVCSDFFRPLGAQGIQCAQHGSWVQGCALPDSDVDVRVNDPNLTLTKRILGKKQEETEETGETGELRGAAGFTMTEEKGDWRLEVVHDSTGVLLDVISRSEVENESLLKTAHIVECLHQAVDENFFLTVLLLKLWVRENRASFQPKFGYPNGYTFLLLLIFFCTHRHAAPMLPVIVCRHLVRDHKEEWADYENAVQNGPSGDAWGGGGDWKTEDWVGTSREAAGEWGETHARGKEKSGGVGGENKDEASDSRNETEGVDEKTSKKKSVEESPADSVPKLEVLPPSGPLVSLDPFELFAEFLRFLVFDLQGRSVSFELEGRYPLPVLGAYAQASPLISRGVWDVKEAFTLAQKCRCRVRESSADLDTGGDWPSDWGDVRSTIRRIAAEDYQRLTGSASFLFMASYESSSEEGSEASLL